jgi:hypothetical protein
LVPNGKLLGQQLGDRYPSEEAWQKSKLASAAAAAGLKNVSAAVGKPRPVDTEEGPGA